MFGRYFSIHVGSTVSSLSPQASRFTGPGEPSDAAFDGVTMSSTSMAIIDEPKTAPTRVGSNCPRASFASAIASLDATRPNCTVRDIIRRLLPTVFSLGSLLSKCLRALKSLTSPAMRDGNRDTSNARTGPTPLAPSHSARQQVAASPPIGVSAPLPVMTARRCPIDPSPCKAASGLLLDRLQQAFQFATEHKVAVTERLLRPGLVQVGERDLRFA